LQAPSERFAEAFAAVKEYLGNSTKLDAIVGCNDQLAAAALQAVKARGLQVPRDIMITGFNALETWQYCSPNLTTVRSQPRELGILAGNALIDRLDSGEFVRKEIVLPVSLQPGQSTER
jgi:LacI family transcriptional regulator